MEVASLERLVRIYQGRNRRKLEGLLIWFKQLPSLEEVIRTATLGLQPDGKRHLHQRRLARDVLQEAAKRLVLAAPSVSACVSFDELIGLVRSKTNGIKGFGELAAYDTALRIGAFMSIYPSSVHLHAGTRVGARALGFDRKRDTLEMGELPTPIQVLTPHEVEDFLCIYKAELAKQHAERQEPRKNDNNP